MNETLGFQLIEQRRSTEAEKLFREALRLRPHDAESLFGLGGALCQLGRWEEGITALEEAIQYNADQDIEIAHGARKLLGYAHYYLGHTHDAVFYYQEALSFEPDDPELHLDLGQCHAVLGEWDKSIEAFQKTIALQHDNAEAHFGLGVVYNRVGRKQEAWDKYEVVKKLNIGWALELKAIIRPSVWNKLINKSRKMVDGR